MTARRYHWDKQ